MFPHYNIHEQGLHLGSSWWEYS